MSDPALCRFRLLQIYETQATAEDIWDFDEKGFTIGQIKRWNVKLIVPVHPHHRKRRQPGNHQWVTLMECISAAGKHIPAFYITHQETPRALRVTYNYSDYLGLTARATGISETISLRNGDLGAQCLPVTTSLGRQTSEGSQ